MQRLEEYNLLKCASRMYWKCDLKTILRKDPDLKHLHFFCWGHFVHIYQHIISEDFPNSRKSVSAEKSVQLLWYVTEKIFGDPDDLQQCQDFNELFTKFKKQKSRDVQHNLLHSKGFIDYQTCVYQKSYKIL